MPIEMGVWRIDGDTPRRLTTTALPNGAMLEDFLERDASLLGTRLLVIGRQVRTPSSRSIDLLAVDAEGAVHLLVLKRDQTPRDVVAEALDHGSWVSTLTRDSVIDVANRHLGVPFEAAFSDTFGAPPPDELNTDLRLTIVATELDDSSERIVAYLRTFGVPINAVFFAHLVEDDRRYLARSWLVDPTETTSPPATTNKGKRADWNGRDWFVNFGESPEGRSWEDARRFGFVSAGRGGLSAGALRAVPVGARVNVHIPGAGYVALGVTLAEAERFDRARVLAGNSWVALGDLPLQGTYGFEQDRAEVGDEDTEYVIPVRWIWSAPRENAYWESGMFAQQDSACKLRQEFTVDKLARHVGLDALDQDQPPDRGVPDLSDEEEAPEPAPRRAALGTAAEDRLSPRQNFYRDDTRLR